MVWLFYYSHPMPEARLVEVGNRMDHRGWCPAPILVIFRRTSPSYSVHAERPYPLALCVKCCKHRKMEVREMQTVGGGSEVGMQAMGETQAPGDSRT